MLKCYCDENQSSKKANFYVAIVSLLCHKWLCEIANELD